MIEIKEFLHSLLQTQNPPVLALGYWLDEAAWSKGYTTEAIKAWQRK